MFRCKVGVKVKENRSQIVLIIYYKDWANNKKITLEKHEHMFYNKFALL